jgi:Ni/Co efflux regulator RcnB
VQVAPVQAQAKPERQQAQGRDRQQRQANPQGNFRNQVQPQVQPQAAPQVQAFQRNQAVPPRHAQQHNHWQSSNQNWNSNTVWQRDRNWWRGNNAFRNYTGARLNFFFAPGFGYYSVPRQYWHHSRHPGDYLPRYFMRYVVNDYRAYGLPRPPYNCRWIWVNNSILLVDRSDRYILDEVRIAW